MVPGFAANGWLRALLSSRFFGPCQHHSNRRKNEENVFCMDCNEGFCRHCLKSHSFHKQLQICKYVYQDVVRVQDIQKHLDCSKIQTYKINGEKAVHLNPRPQSKDAKPSTKAKFGGSCEACKRYLQDVPNRFCSISCKVFIVSTESTIPCTVSEFSELTLRGSYEERLNSENECSVSESYGSDNNQMVDSCLGQSRRSRKRKSSPRRAPFF